MTVKVEMEDCETRLATRQTTAPPNAGEITARSRTGINTCFPACRRKSLRPQQETTTETTLEWALAGGLGEAHSHYDARLAGRVRLDQIRAVRDVISTTILRV